MREYETQDEAITEIGDASVLTKGERLDSVFESTGAPDKYDRV